MRFLEYAIPKKWENTRVGDYLKHAEGFSRRIITRLKRTKDGIAVNGVRARTVDILKEGDILIIGLGEEKIPDIPALGSVSPLYEDEDVVVLDKAGGMPVHPSYTHYTNTLANLFFGYYQAKGIYLPFRPVNRLDKDTSGIVVAAKNAYAASRLAGRIDKYYLAVADGLLYGEGIIDAPIARNSPDSFERVVSNEGKRAVTVWKALGQGENNTLLRVYIKTGRTHQIRVHMSHIGHPLTGDMLYGKPCELIARHALHCRRVWFRQPVTGEDISITSPVPKDFALLLDSIGLETPE